MPRKRPLHQEKAKAALRERLKQIGAGEGASQKATNP
jgi:hypothetical protein